jgi:hypothetical protein
VVSASSTSISPRTSPPAVSPRAQPTTKVVFSKPTNVTKNRDAVKELLRKAGVDESVIDTGLNNADNNNNSSSSNTATTNNTINSANASTASTTMAISSPTDVKKNPEIVKAMLALGGIDPNSMPAKAVPGRPQLCQNCNVRKVKARIQRHNVSHWLCVECVDEHKRRFQARGMYSFALLLFD